MPREFFVELACSPTRIPQRDHKLARPPAFGNRPQDIDGSRQRPPSRDINRPLSAPIIAVKDKAPARFYRAAKNNGRIGRATDIDFKLLQKLMQTQIVDLLANPDTHRAVRIMGAHGDDRMVKPRVADAGHREQELPRQKDFACHGAILPPRMRQVQSSLGFGVSAHRIKDARTILNIPASNPIDTPLDEAKIFITKGRIMTIKVGDKLPTTMFTKATDHGPEAVDSDSYFKGRKVALFSVPGAFTPTCSAKHLPGYLEQAAALKAKGVDEIACTAVNDAFVLGAWSKMNNAGDTVTMLGDGNAAFAEAVGLTMDGSKFGMGTRGQRFSMVVDDGIVTQLNVEAPGEFKVSSAEHMLEQL